MIEVLLIVGATVIGPIQGAHICQLNPPGICKDEPVAEVCARAMKGIGANENGYIEVWLWRALNKSKGPYGPVRCIPVSKGYRK